MKTMTDSHIADKTYMQRCIQLARLGAGHVAPNPMVGAVLVYEERIIGEGYHQQYGQAHAEVNCLSAVTEKDRAFITASTLYVSLEPCAHVGKTPPCADLIIRHKIPKVVIGCRDPFTEVNGKGIAKLENAGIEVVSGIQEEECRELNKRFFTWQLQRRPYIILKWAQTANGKIAGNGDERLLISNACSNRLAHCWRSEEAGILVGTRTALLDNPQLTTRLWNGPSPVRMVIDMDLKLPHTLHLFNRKVHTIIFNALLEEEKEGLHYYKLSRGNLVPQLLDALHRLNMSSVIVEGGAQLIQSFIDAGCWDEARIITNPSMIIAGGLNAPDLTGAVKLNETTVMGDNISIFGRQEKGLRFNI